MLHTTTKANVGFRNCYKPNFLSQKGFDLVENHTSDPFIWSDLPWMVVVIGYCAGLFFIEQNAAFDFQIEGLHFRGQRVKKTQTRASPTRFTRAPIILDSSTRTLQYMMMRPRSSRYGPTDHHRWGTTRASSAWLFHTRELFKINYGVRLERERETDRFGK